MGIFRDDSSSLHQPIPVPILVAIGSVVLVLATYGWKSIREEQERNRITWEVKQGWMTISVIQLYMDQNSGQWPKKWSDLSRDLSDKVDLDFTLSMEELSKNPNRIYSVVKLKHHPELQDRLRPDLEEFREELLSKYREKSK